MTERIISLAALCLAIIALGVTIVDHRSPQSPLTAPVSASQPSPYPKAQSGPACSYDGNYENDAPGCK